jgi:amino acid transporter
VTEPGAESPSPRLVRAIRRWDLTAAVVNGVIGSAIFGLPATIAALTGAWSPIAYLVAGAFVLTIVLSFAEVGSRFEEPGGPYLYAREAFGSFVGFQAGWLTFWIRTTAVAANLNVFVNYLSQIAPLAGTTWGRVTVMTVVLGLITFVNVKGVRQATWAVNGFTVAKLVPIAMLVVIGLVRFRSETLATQSVSAPDWTTAILLLMFAYGGFEAPLIPAGESTNPRRDSAFALLVGMVSITVVYLLVQLVVVGVLPNAGGANAPLAAVLGVLLGNVGVTLASFGAMVSIWGWATGSVLQSPRLIFSMAAQHELPATLARVHSRFRTPHVAIITYSALAYVLAVYGNFEWNATLSAVGRLVTYGLTCGAVLVLRRTRPDDQPGFRVPGGPTIPILGAGFCTWLLLTRPFTQAWVLVFAIVLGSALFLLSQRSRR